MISIEIIIVTFNSTNWLDKCLNSLKESNYDLELISITLVDNNSQDNTISVAEQYEYKNSFGGYKVLKSGSNQGFGTANNIGVKETDKPFVLFVNVDTELHENALLELSSSVLNSNSTVAMWEMRQLPYEHPKLYNPVTLETTWCSGAACLVNKKVFEKCGMFDESIFMYAEDVDLSWRFRIAGYKLLYVPKSVVHHYTYMNEHEIKPRQLQESIINNLRLRYKFGSNFEIVFGYFLIVLYLLIGKNRNKIRKMNMLSRILTTFPDSDRVSHKSAKDKNGFVPLFYKFDYEIIRKGSFYEYKRFSHKPKVSIIVRTKNRAHLLKEALTSIQNQTYTNIEVIVIEDGIDTSSDMISRDFINNLNIVYMSCNESRGRSFAANIGLKHSSGDFLCFLDDDDVLFADHIEVLVSELMNNKEYKIAYSLAIEARVSADMNGNSSYHSVFDQQFNRYLLYKQNFLPIQTVMFSRDVYIQLGGMDESLNYLEDWDLWLRYSAIYEFKYIHKQTSIYKTPAELNIRYQRKAQLINAEQLLFSKHEGFLEKVSQSEIAFGKRLVAKNKSLKSKITKMTLREFVYSSYKSITKKLNLKG